MLDDGKYKARLTHTQKKIEAKKRQKIQCMISQGEPNVEQILFFFNEIVLSGKRQTRVKPKISPAGTH